MPVDSPPLSLDEISRRAMRAQEDMGELCAMDAASINLILAAWAAAQCWDEAEFLGHCRRAFRDASRLREAS